MITSIISSSVIDSYFLNNDRANDSNQTNSVNILTNLNENLQIENIQEKLGKCRR